MENAEILTVCSSQFSTDFITVVAFNREPKLGESYICKRWSYVSHSYDKDWFLIHTGFDINNKLQRPKNLRRKVFCIIP